MQIVEKETVYDIKFKYYKSDNYFEIKCYKDEKKLGYLTFKVSGKHLNEVFVYQIKTISTLNKGVGSSLIDALEYFVYINNIESFDAKYYPTTDNIKDFYAHRGYKIYKDGYESYIYKYYNKSKIEKDILPKIINVSQNEKDSINLRNEKVFNI